MPFYIRLKYSGKAPGGKPLYQYPLRLDGAIGSKGELAIVPELHAIATTTTIEPMFVFFGEVVAHLLKTSHEGPPWYEQDTGTIELIARTDDSGPFLILAALPIPIVMGRVVRAT